MDDFPSKRTRIIPKLFRVDGHSEWMASPENGREYFRSYSEWTAIPSGWLSQKYGHLEGPGKGGWAGGSDPIRTKSVGRLGNLYIKGANCDAKKRP